MSMTQPMWIAHVPYDKSDGRLRVLYDRVKGSDNRVDNIMLAHSLRPHTMEGHMALYKSVLHHSGNQLPTWFLEVLGVYVSMLNACRYCVAHHFAGLQRLLADDARSREMLSALDGQVALTDIFDATHVAALAYAGVLTQSVHDETALKTAVARLRDHGCDDGRILEINQVVAYFNYANRTVLGLGVTTNGDTLGLSPGNADNPNDWAHR